jgi:hypothetical protein
MSAQLLSPLIPISDCYVCGIEFGTAWGFSLPIRSLLAAESGVFGPEEIEDIARAFEAALKDLGLTDREDPVTIMLARLTIELAKQGQFTAASLRARVLKEMQPKRQPN